MVLAPGELEDDLPDESPGEHQTTRSGCSAKLTGTNTSATAAVPSRSQKSKSRSIGGVASSMTAIPSMQSARPAQKTQTVSSYFAWPPDERIATLTPMPSAAIPE